MRAEARTRAESARGGGRTAEAGPDPLAAIEAEVERAEAEVTRLEEKLALDWTDTERPIAAHRGRPGELQALLARWERLLEGVGLELAPAGSRRWHAADLLGMTVTRILACLAVAWPASTSARTGTSKPTRPSCPHRHRHCRSRRRHLVPGDAREPHRGLRAGRVGRLHPGRQADGRGEAVRRDPPDAQALPQWGGRRPRLLKKPGECPVEVKEAAIAVNVLSHEAWHLAGVRDEAATQCYALQTNADTAARLGASHEDAAAIAVFIVREVQPVLPADYRSMSTRLLDLRLARAWP